MIIYNMLWETMKKRGISKYALVHKHGIAQKTISRMIKNMPTSSITIDSLCQILDCTVQDVMTFVPNEKPEQLDITNKEKQ